MTTQKRKTPPHAWKPGESGNPKGKPPGSGELQKLRAAMGKRLPAILQAMTARALEGDPVAARLILERTLPALKPTELPQMVKLPDGTLAEQGRAVLAAVASGELAPSQGVALLGAVGALARIVEIDELEDRISLLENRHAIK